MFTVMIPANENVAAQLTESRLWLDAHGFEATLWQPTKPRTAIYVGFKHMSEAKAFAERFGGRLVRLTHPVPGVSARRDGAGDRRAIDLAADSPVKSDQSR